MQLYKREKNELILTFVYLVFVLFVSSMAYGQAKKVRVVYTQWYPYTYQYKGYAYGLEIEIFKAVMKSMDLDYEFRAHPWARCLHSLKTGEADVLISLLKTREREKYTYYPKNYISISRTVFFTTTHNKLKFNGSYEELKGYSIGVVRGFSYGDAFDSAKYLKKDPANNTELLIKKLLIGRNHLAAENQIVVSALAHNMGVDDKIRFLGTPIHTKRLYVGFSKIKGLKQMCENFSESLGRFKKSRLYRSILKKYGLSYSDMVE